MIKNGSGQKLTIFAFIPSTGLPKTGDAANITAYVSKDDGAVTVLTDTSATEADATNAKGLYRFDVAQAESNADKLDFTAKSSTSDVSIVPVTIYTRPANASLLSIDSNGRVDVIKIAGTTQTARDIGASVLLAAAQKVDVDTIKTNPVVNAGTVTFPTGATLASTTNITAGTIATVTNLTNAPTAGDLTATMKTSVTTAATAATPIAASVTGAVGSVTAGVALTSGERSTLAAALLDLADAIETGVTLRGSQRLMLAALAGLVSGAAGTEVTFRNAVANTKDRIVATVDSVGDRTAITYDQT